MITQQQRTALLFFLPFVLLAIPLVAMQFTSEVQWEFSDFVVMGILLFGSAFLCEMVLRNVKTTKNRLIICFGILLGLVLLWMEMAVGILGSPIAGS